MKRRVLIAVFLAGSGLLFAQQVQDLVGATGIRYPILDEEGNKTAEIMGDSVENLENGMVRIENLEWSSLKEGERNMKVTTPMCRYNPKSQVLAAETTIRIELPSMVINGTGYICDMRNKKLFIINGAEVEVTDMKLLGNQLGANDDE